MRLHEDKDLFRQAVIAAAEYVSMIQDYGMAPFAPFEVNVLQPSRTFCEKIMSLVRFSYSEQPIEGLRVKIRHVYDLHKIFKADISCVLQSTFWHVATAGTIKKVTL